MGFLATMKYFFSRYNNLPLDTSDKDKVQNFTEVKTLANSCLKNKSGPLVIFFEVKKFQQKIYQLGHLDKRERCFGNK